MPVRKRANGWFFSTASPSFTKNEGDAVEKHVFGQGGNFNPGLGLEFEQRGMLIENIKLYVDFAEPDDFGNQIAFLHPLPDFGFL